MPARRDQPAAVGFDGNSSIATWVEDNYKSQTVGAYTVYDLTQPK